MKNERRKSGEKWGFEEKGRERNRRGREMTERGKGERRKKGREGGRQRYEKGIG